MMYQYWPIITDEFLLSEFTGGGVILKQTNKPSFPKQIEDQKMYYPEFCSDLTLVRMAILKKSTKTSCWRGCGETGTLLYYWWECKFMHPTVENSMEVP